MWDKNAEKKDEIFEDDNNREGDIHDSRAYPRFFEMTRNFTEWI